MDCCLHLCIKYYVDNNSNQTWYSTKLQRQLSVSRFDKTPLNELPTDSSRLLNSNISVINMISYLLWLETNNSIVIDNHFTTPIVSKILAKRRVSPEAMARQVSADFASS